MSQPNPGADALNQISTALSTIDQATTDAGAAATAIQAKLSSLHQQIADAPDLVTAQQLGVQAQAEAAKLTPLAAALTAMGQPDNPVPVPVPVV